MSLDIIKQVSKIEDKNTLVSIMILCSQILGADTISEIARKEGKTRRGILTSNRYRKEKIGKQTIVIPNLEDQNLPF